MSGGFGRSYGRLTVVARAGGALVPVPGATVRLYLPGTTTPYGGALYPSADSLAPITFPALADAGGTLDLWGTAPLRLDAEVSSSAYGTQRETLDLELPPDDTDAADTRYVNVDGDTMTGDLTLLKASPTITLIRPGDTDPRVRLVEGGIEFGPGTTAPDTWLYRTGVGFLDVAATMRPWDTIYDLGTSGARWRKVWATDAEFTNPPTVGGSPLQTQSAADTRYVNTTGDTMTGPLTVGGADPEFILEGAAGTSRLIRWKTATAHRWAMYLIDSETGSNAGSNLYLSRYSDASDFLGPVLMFNRATGAATFGVGGGLTISNNAGQPQIGTGGGTYLYLAPSGGYILPVNPSVYLGAAGPNAWYGIYAGPGGIDSQGPVTVAGNLGLFGTAATTKKTVTGSRGANAALASLLTQLATYGLITDSSTA